VHVWEPKTGEGRASALVTLLILRSLSSVPQKLAARAVVERREKLGIAEKPRTVRNHIRYLLREGLLEPLVVNGIIYVRVSEKGEELARSIFSG